MYKLFKLSAPGWTQTFLFKEQVQQELYKHMCGQCRAEEGLTEISDIDQMLASACGCEYDVEYNEDGRFDYLGD